MSYAMRWAMILLALSCSNRDEAPDADGSVENDGPDSDGPGGNDDGKIEQDAVTDGNPPGPDSLPEPTCPYPKGGGPIQAGEYCPTGTGCDDGAGLSCQFIALLGTFICTSLCADNGDCDEFGAGACCTPPIGKQKNGPFCVPVECKVCE